MNLEVFLPPDADELRALVSETLALYPELFRIRWHASVDPERYHRLRLASLPLDDGTGHTLDGEPAAGALPGDVYAYYGGYAAAGEIELPAIAIFDRMALLPGSGGPPRRERPGVWRVNFQVGRLLLAALHQALEEALSELREARGNLETLAEPERTEEEIRLLLDVTAEALRRARWS